MVGSQRCRRCGVAILAASSCASIAVAGDGRNYACDPVAANVVRDAPEDWPLCAPQLIIAGAEKCGTTSVYEYLKAHPDFLPVNGSFLFTRKQRARIVRSLQKLKDSLFKQGVPPPQMAVMFDEARWRRHAGDLTEEEVNLAEPLDGEAMKFRPPELEMMAAPVRFGKEVRYYIRIVQSVMQALGLSDQEAYGRYLDMFPRVPAPSSTGESPPPHLAANLGKITGEASPQYLEMGAFAAQRILEYSPSAKLVFLLREPVQRFQSEARMIHGMKGRPMDPSMENFEESVLRCFTDSGIDSQARNYDYYDSAEAKERKNSAAASDAKSDGKGKGRDEKIHRSVKTPYVPGGGAVARMRRIPFEKLIANGEDIRSSNRWKKLYSDINACFSHGLGQFAYKGIYVEAFQRWLGRGKAPLSQMLVLPSEELYKDPVATMHKIADFAGLTRVPDEAWRNATNYRYNPSFDPRTVTFTTKIDHAEDAASQAELVKEKLILSPKAQELLQAFYQRPNCALRTLLKVNWSSWGWSYCDDEAASVASVTSTDRRSVEL